MKVAIGTSEATVETRSKRRKVNPLENVTLITAKAKSLSISSGDDEISVESEIDEDQRWVQCENPNCLKWRTISPEDADKLDPCAPWFCHMNADVLLSSCDIPEEKFKSNCKLKQRGLAYTYSVLPEGSLVWAKLSGYCKWPAILCCPPQCCEYVILDNDGDPYSYHVEFLGTRHSIAWTHHTKVDAYGNLGKQEALESCSQPLSMISMSRFKTGRKRRKRGVLAPKKKVSVQLAEQLQSAIDEADGMLGLEDPDRLNNCQYRYKEKIAEDESDDLRKSAGKKQVKKAKNKHKKGKKNSPSHVLSSSQISDHLTDHKLTDFSSREERLMADIQGLQVLEKEFIEDYANFTKKKLSLITGPRWQGVDVNLFQLFMSVQEKGGFNEVCTCMRWKEVFQDCCNMIAKSNSASTAMTYYSRHLLNYEIHVNGGESSLDLPKAQKRAKGDKVARAKRSKKKKETRRKTRAHNGRIGIVCEDEAVKDLREIENLLNEFNEEEEENPEEAPAPERHESHPKESSMGFYFNDDSQPPKRSTVYSTLEMSQPQSKQDQDDCVGVHYEELFGDVSPSQVVPDVAPILTVTNDVTPDQKCASSLSSTHSEEDIFAEIARDEEFLMSILDTT